MTPLPAFYHRRAVPEDAAVLDEAEGALVTRGHGVVALECFKPWREDFERIYRRHGAGAVQINSTASWKGLSLDFLRRLPNLRRVRLGLDVPFDLTLVGELKGLEALDLNWRVPGSPGEVNFRGFDRLRECSISWHPAFASLLNVRSLRYPLAL